MDPVHRGGKQRGGGLCFVYNQYARINRVSTKKFRAFEYALWKVECKGIYCSVIGLYRPPPTSKTGLSDGQFIDEFLEMLAELMPKFSNLIILGDLNFHWLNMQNPLVEILEDSMRIVFSHWECNN